MGQRGRGSVFRGLQCLGRARGRNARDSRLEGEGVANSCPSVESERGFATGAVGPRIDESMDSPLAGRTLRYVFFAAEDSVEVERDHPLEKSDRFQLGNEQS